MTEIQYYSSEKCSCGLFVYYKYRDELRFGDDKTFSFEKAFSDDWVWYGSYNITRKRLTYSRIIKEETVIELISRHVKEVIMKKVLEQ